MMLTRDRLVVLGGVFLYLFVFGFACGVASERVRFDQKRAVALQRYDDAVQQWHVFLMTAERRAEAHAADDAPDGEVR